MNVRNDAGLTTTEWSMLTGVVLLLILMPIQLAFREHAFQVAQGAARQAVAVAQTRGASDADGVAAAESFLAAAGNLGHHSVVVTRTVDSVTAEVTGLAPGFVPFVDLEIAARASGPLERFIAGSER